MRRKFWIGLLLVLVVGLGIVSIARAQTGSGFDLSWNVISNGGGTGVMSGSGFSLEGTLGQTDAGPIANDVFEVRAGYWDGQAYITTPILLPIIIR